MTTSRSSSRHETDESSAVCRESLIEDLLRVLKEAPSNAPTSRRLTQDILTKVTNLEPKCPTPDEQVLQKSAGNWELLWTTQDTSSRDFKKNPFRAWINPLENQAYSNNPDGESMGRSNPFLPQRFQDRLEKFGFTSGSARSSQIVDLDKQRVRNVVTFQFPGRRNRQATLFVDIKIKPTVHDPRRVDVQFQSCRLVLPRRSVVFPLGLFGPRGWIRTNYVDETIRISRGHKGSIFVLRKKRAALV